MKTIEIIFIIILSIDVLITLWWRYVYQRWINEIKEENKLLIESNKLLTERNKPLTRTVDKMAGFIQLLMDQIKEDAEKETGEKGDLVD